jgi:NRAMP (natural resistance-associated macrophage protein)-like metal ion transporter
MAKRANKSSYGPGFLVTAAFIGPGTITTCSLAGANFGFTLIYVIIFAILTTIILQEMTGRLSLASGRDLAQALREFPQKTLTRVMFIILTLSAITFGCAAYEAGNIIGGALGLESITSIPQRYWVGLISILAIVILNSGRYRLIERFLVLLVFLMSLSFLSAVMIIKPDFLAVLRSFVPAMPRGSLYYALALIGTTVVPYNLFLHSSAVKKKWSFKSNIKEVRKDLVLSIGLGGLISASVIVTSATAFFDKGIVLEKGVQMAHQLKPLFGQVTHILFGVGLFSAGLSSAVTAPYAAAFASSGVMGWDNSQDSHKFKLIWLLVILAGFGISLFRLNPLSVIVFAQVANGIILPIAGIFLLFVLNNRDKMGVMANNWKQNILGGLIIVIVSGLGLWNIVKLFL